MRSTWDIQDAPGLKGKRAVATAAHGGVWDWKPPRAWGRLRSG
jgi:hypothetical protein